MNHPTVSTVELKKKKTPTIIDVREPEEFEAGHIPGAVNIPLGTIHEFDSDNTEDTIYLVCRSGRRSGVAADTLIEKGYQAVNVEGGMLDWSGPVLEEK